MDSINRCIYLLFFFAVLTLQSQEIPPIQVFSPQDYKAEDQNWAITQTQNNFIYVANNAGLLEYNGATWELYKSPNNDILRSAKSVGDIIYTGGYMDFGYWQKDNFGALIYKSLVAENSIKVKEDEEFWGIINIENYVLFQSFERIYIYNSDDKSFDIISSDNRINKIFEVNKTVYFQNNNKGLYKIESGETKLVIPSLKLGDIELVNIYQLDNSLLLQTKTKGFYSYVNNEVQVWNKNVNEILSLYNVYSSIRLKDGSFILGTISNGVLFLNEDGTLKQRIDQVGGISNNTILSLKEDNNGNIWLGLDNGIDVINLDSRYKVFKDENGALGTVYVSKKVDGYLYLGTNQGLFYKPLDSNNKFKIIDGTKGQVWTLNYIKGTLFCGHDQGTFIINRDKATKISYEIGNWIIKPIKDKPHLLLQGNYRGLNILELVDGEWKYRNKLRGFDISSRFIEFVSPNEILVNHEYKGVYKLTINQDFTNVESVEKLNINHGIKSSLVNYNNSILYCYKEGVFSFDKNSNTFVKDSVLSSLFTGDSYLSGKLINEEYKNRLWGFTKDRVIYIEPGLSLNSPEIDSIEISDEMRKIKTGFENILNIKDEQYLIGNKEGYIIINTNSSAPKPFRVYLNKASYTSLQNEFTRIDFSKPITLKNKHNSIRFSYSAPNYDKLSNPKYQYKLVGIYDNWSNWSTSSDVLFENLPHGDYELKVRAKSGSVYADNVLSYSFTIDKPWYQKPLAMIVYAVLFLLLAFLVQYFNRRFYRRQQQKAIEKREGELELERLENQRQLMEFKNKNLQLDIDNKNKELGTATMNLVKRNELLNSIKEELSKSKSLEEVKKVTRMINSSLNNTNDWKLFEEAFNNVDKDFMKKVKSLHPAITPNDLRLCAYLRLNLSSKEIAPLLNISHKSVEVKRYRLRKKMGLDQNQSLSNYIIEL